MSGLQIENPGRIPGGRGGSGVYKANMAERSPGVKNFTYAKAPSHQRRSCAQRMRGRVTTARYPFGRAVIRM